MHELRVIVFAACWAAAWSAQAAPAAPVREPTASELDTVVVTARRRDEALADVPVSAAVVDRRTIEAFAIDNPRELLRVVPGVRVNINVGAEAADDIVIRGVGVARIDGSASPTGIYRNGVFIGNGTFFGRTFTRFDMFDIDRLEVFRGPQGALWGRNAAGGAVNLVSARPRFGSEGRATAAYGFEQRDRRLELIENLALNETAAVRLAILDDDRQGGLYTITDPASPLNGAHPDAARFRGVRSAIRLRPDARWDLVLTAEHQAQADPSFTDYMSKPGRGDPGKFHFACLGPPAIRCSFNLPDGRVHMQTDNVFLNAVRSDSVGELRLSGLYTRRRAHSLDDLDVFTYPGQATSKNNTNPRRGSFTKTGVEALYVSNRSGQPRLRWLLGADYQRSRDTYVNDNQLGFLNAAGATVATVLSDSTAIRRLNSASAFGSLEYDVTRRFSVSVEARFTRNRMSTYARNATLTTVVATGAVSGVPLVSSVPTKEDKFTPVATATYALAPRQKVYARLATGFRPGGFEPRAAAGAFFPPYRAEDLRSFEVGYKARFAAVAVELAAYYARHRHFQVTDIFVNDAGQPVSRIGDGGRAWTGGIEAGARAVRELGPGRFELSAAYAFSTGRIGHDRPASPYAGKRAPETRDYQTQVTAAYEAPIASWPATAWFANLAVHAEGGGFQDPANAVRLANYQQFDASLGLKRSGWRLQIFGRNLANEIYRAQSLSVFGAPVYIYSLPRTTGVELGRRW